MNRYQPDKLWQAKSDVQHSVQTQAANLVATNELLYRLKIGRNRLYDLRASGRLTPGVHWIATGEKNGRFLWDVHAVENYLRKQTASAAEDGPEVFGEIEF